MDESQATRYAGPLSLASALSRFALTGRSAPFTGDGPRADVEYRDLGLAQASGGAIGARHIRAIRPFDQATGWHWHDMSGHFNFVLRGWIKFRFAGMENEVKVKVKVEAGAGAGACLSQPAGVPHNVVGRSDDMELIEINLLARYSTVDLGGPLTAPQPPH